MSVHVEKNESISDIKFLNNPTFNKIVFTNINTSRMFFNRIHSYLSDQLYYIETQQKHKYDSNILELYCCIKEDSIQNDSINQRFNINSIHFSGKNTCSVDICITDMNINVRYKLPTMFKQKYEKDCNDNDDLIVEYNIRTHSKTTDDSIIKDNYITEYTCIEFYPINKLSLKYFNLFISSIVHKTKKKNIHFLTDTSNLTVYINIESYWEELFNRPTRSIESIYLPKEEKNKIIDDVSWFIKPETQLRYEQLGRNYKRVILFEGIPGSGKTSFALSIASHFGYDLAILSFTDKVTDGTFTRLIRQMPEKTILLLEDIDCLFHDRKSDDTRKNQVTFSGILNTLDGIATPHKFICIVTTNYKNILDDALLRPGRVDQIMSFDTVRKNEIKDIYKAYMGDSYDVDTFKTFYNAYKDLNVDCSVSLIQEYLFKYLDDPVKTLENIDEIKNIKEKSTKIKVNVYT